MKKVMFFGATVLVAVVLLSVIASAQPGQGGGGRGRGPGGGPGGPEPGAGIGMLLRNSDVKEQLGLTDEQSQKIEKIIEENRGNRPQRPDGPPSPEEMEKMRAEMDKRRQETQNKVKQVLTPEQQEKAKVLVFQISGGLSSPFVNADTLEVLSLTSEQKAKLKAIEDERGAAMREVFEKMRGLREKSEEERRKLGDEMRAKGDELRKATEQKIQAILTEEQKAKAAQLSEEGKDLREKFQQQMRDRGGRGPRGDGPPPEGEYRPGANSWQPGQGGNNRPAREGERRRAFPKADKE